MLRTLALDMGASTGWAISNPLVHGVQKIKNTGGRRWIEFRDWLFDTISEHGIERVVIETPQVRYYHASKALFGYMATVEMVCEITGCELGEYKATQIKKFATGGGRATKDEMLEAARVRWGHVEKHDEADALWLLELSEGL